MIPDGNESIGPTFQMLQNIFPALKINAAENHIFHVGDFFSFNTAPRIILCARATISPMCVIARFSVIDFHPLRRYQSYFMSIKKKTRSEKKLSPNCTSKVNNNFPNVRLYTEKEEKKKTSMRE